MLSAYHNEPRIALVGCGTVGDLHRTRLLEQNASIAAVCDPDSDALARMAGRLPQRPRLFRSEQDLLAAGLVDAAVLCTPHGRHGAQVRACLEAGVHVLCEKPFVTDPTEAAALVSLAREKERALFVSLARRGRGHTRFLMSTVGRIGPVKHVVMTRAQPWLSRHGRTWRVRAAEGGGFLLDAGASLIDLLMLLLEGDPVIEADAHLFSLNHEVDVRGSVHLTFRNGVRADISLVGDATESIETILIFGERGTAGWTLRDDGSAPALWVRPAGGEIEFADSARYRGPLPDTAFVSAIRSGRSFGRDSAPDLYDAASLVPLVTLLDRIRRDATRR